MASFGLSFLPGQGDDERDQVGGGAASGVPPLQQAVRMLSLRLPRFGGPGAIAPPGLLNAPGAMGNPAMGPNAAFAGRSGQGNPLFEALMRLAGMFGGGGMGGPRVVPGVAPLPSGGGAPMPRPQGPPMPTNPPIGQHSAPEDIPGRLGRGMGMGRPPFMR